MFIYYVSKTIFSSTILKHLNFLSNSVNSNVNDSDKMNKKKDQPATVSSATTQTNTKKDSAYFSIQYLHSHLVEQVFKKLELISINSIMTSNMTTISSSENSNNIHNNFSSKNFSINPKLASAENCDEALVIPASMPVIKSQLFNMNNSHLKKSFTLTRKYSSKEQQNEHEQQKKRQSIKSHSSLKNLSNLGEYNTNTSTNSATTATANYLNIDSNQNQIPLTPNSKLKYRKAKSSAGSRTFGSNKFARLFRNRSSSSGTTTPSITILNSNSNLSSKSKKVKSVKVKSKSPLSTLSSVPIAPSERQEIKAEYFIQPYNLSSSADKSLSLVNVTPPSQITPQHTPNHANYQTLEKLPTKPMRNPKLAPKSISSVIPMPTITQSFRMDSNDKQSSVGSINSASKPNLNANNVHQSKKLSNQHLNLLKVTPSRSISANISRSSSKKLITYFDNMSNIYHNDMSIETNDANVLSEHCLNAAKRTGDNVSIISSKLSLFKRTVKIFYRFL